MPPPDWLANATPEARAQAAALYDDVVAVVDRLDPPCKTDVLAILWHSLRARYPAYAPAGIPAT